MHPHKTHRLTRRSFVGVLAVGAILLAACGSDTKESVSDTTVIDTPAEKVTLNYFTFSAAPDHLTDLDKIIEAFETENPNISIEVQTASYGDYFTSLQTQVAGQAAPDTFELNYENFVNYARSGALLDLSSYLADGSIDADRYYPLALKGFTDGGKQYGLPATFSTVLMIYNKTLFDKAGLAYPTADWTWEDETAAAIKLTDKKTGTFGSYQPVSFHEFYKALGQAGGSFFGPDGKAAFNDAKGLEAAKWLLDKPGTTMPTLADIGGTPDYDTALFKSGKLAMWHNGIWQFNGLNESGVDYDVVTEPGKATKANAVFMNAAVVSKDTAYPAEAAKWISFLTGSKVTVETRLASSWELPAVNDAAAFASYLTAGKPANRKAVFDNLDNVVLPPVIERQQEMQDIVGKALESVVSGGVSVQDALDKAVADVNKLLG